MTGIELTQVLRTALTNDNAVIRIRAELEPAAGDKILPQPTPTVSTT